MSDLTTQGLLQQLHAKPISGEHLEVLGKKASSLWSEGRCDTLTEAVIETVKHAGLSPEQVKRVIEFTNTDAFLREFKKEGQAHRVVDFGSGGPADPSIILKDLNDGGGGSVFDRGTLDYDQPPMSKAASVQEDDLLFSAFARQEQKYPEVNPYCQVIELRDKLAGAQEHVTSMLSGLEIAYSDLADLIYGDVKQAALQGYSLGDMVQVWSAASPSEEHVKVAFQLLTPRLLREEVFHSVDEVNSSLTKVASLRVVNPRHPAVTHFREYCETLSKLAEFRAAKEELQIHLSDMTNFLKKEATPNPKKVEEGLRPLWHAARDYAGRAGGFVEEPIKNLVHGITGDASLAGAAGGLAHKGIKYAPHIAAVAGANELYRQAKYSPTVNGIMSVTVPVSDAYRRREAEIAASNGYGGYGY